MSIYDYNCNYLSNSKTSWKRISWSFSRWMSKISDSNTEQSSCIAKMSCSQSTKLSDALLTKQLNSGFGCKYAAEEVFRMRIAFLMLILSRVYCNY